MFIVQLHKSYHLCRASKILINSSANLFSQSTSKEYQARKLVGFSEAQMYSVVSDVKNYQSFVPFCTKSKILKKYENNLHATLEIGFPPIIESYTSHVKLIKPQFVSAKCRDGTLFNYLETTWKFSPGLESNTQTCIVDFYIRFDFKSVIYSQVAQMFFEKLVQQMEWAFISEAKRRFGTESVPSYSLTAPPHRAS
ncbi:coenzyme Q-binding protein COQ10 homolog A, mitochondrial [Atheta coriaria]|uniref:coenzyme Q-binding protein COQ10 homolog A, mitochondrial n=1 Tax=Dalotia coriaria TaxID=877792 RepID=UPI0031F464F2